MAGHFQYIVIWTLSTSFFTSFMYVKCNYIDPKHLEKYCILSNEPIIEEVPLAFGRISKQFFEPTIRLMLDYFNINVNLNFKIHLESKRRTI